MILPLEEIQGLPTSGGGEGGFFKNKLLHTASRRAQVGLGAGASRSPAPLSAKLGGGASRSGRRPFAAANDQEPEPTEAQSSGSPRWSWWPGGRPIPTPGFRQAWPQVGMCVSGQRSYFKSFAPVRVPPRQMRRSYIP